MPLPARNTLAIIGAGPVGLEAAFAALDHGFDVQVFEQGEAGSHPLAWGHVRMFTPWRMNLGKHSRAHLEVTGWSAPDPEACPTGAELAEHYLQPLAHLPELVGRIHPFMQVVHASRHGLLRGEASDAGTRHTRPFRLLVRDQGGRESFHICSTSTSTPTTMIRKMWERRTSGKGDWAPIAMGHSLMP
jgi:glycine/D-amino acid oxidase-like deaminating enzyme